MNNKQFDGGLKVSVPDDFEFIDLPIDSTTKIGIRKFFNIVPMPVSISDQKTDDAIINILKESDLDLVKEFDIEPKLESNKRNRGAGGESTVEVKIDLKSDEMAVVLIQQDGMYTWKYASSMKSSPSTRKRGGMAEPTEKTFVFTIDLEISENGAEQKKRGLGNNIIDFAWGKLKTYVFKFIAARTIGLASNLLEKNVKKGIVHINSTDPQTWKKLHKLPELNLPLDKSVTILILIHGTFSSTIGGFGALGGTPWGESFLQTALQNYDAIIGYDHPTLSEDPLQNAEEILQLLNDYHFVHTPTLDVVAHSRGGLVIRSLIEKLLPKAKQEIRINRVIFVACTNGGTLLAEPSNWENLVNLYTNITAGSCRVIGLISPQTKVITTILKDVIESIGSFVRYCAEEAISNKALPGLSAMEPEGDFVKDINNFQTGQPTIAETNYYVITSEFQPSLSGNHEPKELPKRFLQLFSGGFMGQLMKEANDLVVNTKSMDAIDTATGDYVKNRFDFGKNPEVYHTNFFTRPEVIDSLTKWLALQPVISLEKEIPKDPNIYWNSKTRSAGSNYKQTPVKVIFTEHLQPLGNSLLNTISLSPAVDTNIIIVNANDDVKTLKVKMEQEVPSYVVVRRNYQDTLLNYAFKGEEAALMSMDNPDNLQLIDALNLHETDASITQTPEDAIEKKEYDLSSPTRGRNIVVAGNVPVGVVPEIEKVPSAEDLADIAQKIANPLTETDKILWRRTMPSMIKSLESLLSRDTKSPNVLCHFHAELDTEVIVKRMTSLVITVSREIIEKFTNTASKTESRTIEVKKPLIIRVIAKSGFAIEDTTDGRIETDVPLPGLPQEFYVDLRATEKEEKGEIWVVVRQGSVPVVKLVLNPQIVAKKKLSSDKLVAESDALPPTELIKPLNQLWIEDYKTSEGFGYKFDLYSEKLKINRQFKSEVIEKENGDRKKYVDGLYKKIEDRWISCNKDVVNFEQELRALGADLFDELIPKDLQSILWDKRKDFESIQVISTEPFIPWELVHLRKPGEVGMPDDTIFLGQMGLIRWHEGAGQTGWPPEKILIRNERVRYIIPHYPHPDYVLPEAEEEVFFLEKMFDAVRVEPESGKVRDLISKKGSFDLLHFACHGAADSSEISDAKLLMEGRVEKGKYIPDELLATVAAKFSKLKSEEDNTPMVVLNACQAGKAGYKLTGIGGFANAFLMAGAGAFVGTLWSIGDSPARIFTETLYTALDSGKNLSQSTTIARSKAKEEGDATWLAYVVYGHPHLTIVRK